MINQIQCKDVRAGLLELPDNSIDCCVTSPPYYGLRDYGHPDQIGLEQTPDQYVAGMVQVFEQVRRVLKPEGTLWLNLGDSYANTRKPGGGDPTIGTRNLGGKEYRKVPVPEGLKRKDLIGIPWMVAFALRSAGWYLRQDIIWHKPNPMPESVTDRCTKAHEYIFLLSKSQKYFYDHEAIKQEAKDAKDDYRRLTQQKADNKRNPTEMVNGIRPKSWNGSSFDKGKTGEMKHTRGGRKSGNKERKPGSEIGCPEGTGSNVCGSVPWEGMKANKRSVWTVTTKPFKEAHFATYPPDLITPCILAGCPEGGVVLDPFMGAGTTALVALRNNRLFTGFELNPDYIAIAEKRLEKEFPEYKDYALL